MPRPIEFFVAEAAHNILRAVERGEIDPGQLPPRELCNDLSSSIGRLLGKRLEGGDGWPAGNWVDDILTPVEIPWAGVRTALGECEIAGLAVWSDRTARQEWADPFVGRVHIDSQSGKLLSYELHFAAASSEIGLIRYKRHWADEFGSAPPSGWRFSFAWREP